MSNESNCNAEMSKTLTEMLNVLKVNVDISKNSESDLRRVYKSLDKLADLVSDQIRPFTNRQRNFSRKIK